MYLNYISYNDVTKEKRQQILIQVFFPLKGQ